MDIHNSKKLVTIIIPALNEEKNIGRCLQSIENLNTPKGLFEIIVIDNGSTDATCEIAKTFEDILDIRTIVVRNVTIAALRNTGANQAKGDILAFLDADCTVSENWLNNAVKYFEEPLIGAVGSSYFNPEETSWVAEVWDLTKGERRKSGFRESLPSGNLFVDKNKFNSISGFNEGLITNEDFDLCFRFRDAGFKIYSDPDIKAIHWGVPDTLSNFYRKTRWHGTNVFDVFLSNIKKYNNIRVVLYGLYFAFIILGIVVSFITALFGYNIVLLVVMVFALLFPPLCLSINTLLHQKKTYKYLPKLTVMYLIYGIARAHSIFDNILIKIK